MVKKLGRGTIVTGEAPANNETGEYLTAQELIRDYWQTGSLDSLRGAFNDAATKLAFNLPLNGTEPRRKQ